MNIRLMGFWCTVSTTWGFNKFWLLAPRLSWSRLSVAPIFIINKSRSRTRLFFNSSISFCLCLVIDSCKSGKFVKVLSRSRLGLETKGTRLSVSSRSRFNFDYKKVSVSDSSSYYFFKKSRSRSRHKILVSSLSGTSVDKPEEVVKLINNRNWNETGTRPRVFCF